MNPRRTAFNLLAAACVVLPFAFLCIPGGFIWAIHLAVGDTPARKRRQRWEKHQCLQCGYSLVGNLSGICPECGTAVEMLMM